MRYIRIFFLHFQTVFEHRTRSFVWFLISLLNPMLLLLFWRGVPQSHSSSWSYTHIASYYFLLVVASSLLTAHVEEEISRHDIQYGGLSKYLVRPFSYFWMKFYEEIPYRLLQGGYGMIACGILLLFFGNFFTFSHSPLILLLSIIIIIGAYFLSFLFKVIIGLLSFWLVDTGGFYQLIEMMLLIFAGYLLPLELLPPKISEIAKVLPFAYMIYFPVVAVEGRLSVPLLFQTLSIQAGWILVCVLLYRMLWAMGLRKFTALGQ